ncbi:hypothetical protein [Komagataeibacter xylinus]|uniref:hypothetical protein n=1 Tax=Komagataeibacter xylinus TaxID=28448 RepID=UPI00280B90D3|nr:hypothetical protein [Komagataeibacter xylinus]
MEAEFLSIHNSLPDKDLAKHFSVYVSTIEKWRVRLGVKKTANRWDINPHPRGALGMRHSDKARHAISKSASAWWEALSDEDKNIAVLKRMKTREKNGTLYPSRRASSWKAGWREIGGKRIYFRSAWEANFARYLNWLQEKGEISEWEHEPETFWFDQPKKTIDGKRLGGIRRGVVSYLPDFVVTELPGSLTYYEVKGWMDAKSKTKIARMRLYYPEISLRVIDGKSYADLKKKMSMIIPGWEDGTKKNILPEKCPNKSVQSVKSKLCEQRTVVTITEHK